MAMECTWRWFGPHDTVTLKYLREMGLEGIVTALHQFPAGVVWPKEEIMRVKDMIEAEGMHWSVVESLPVAEGIKICSPEWPYLIDNYKQSLRNLAACGIDTVCYNFMPVLDWARTDLHYLNERGTESMLFDYEVFAAFDIHILKRPGAESDYTEKVLNRAKEIALGMSEIEKEELAHNLIIVTQAFINGVMGNNTNDYKQQFLNYLETYKEIGPDKLRENLSRFLKEIVPVAESCGIRLCIHPDDPPFPLLGLPRIASTIDDLKWICAEVESPSNGITLCVGSLSACPENNIPDIIKQLGNNIHFIHLRNTTRLKEKSFYESGHLDGDTDMYQVVKALLEEQIRRKKAGRKDIRLPFRPDHGLKMALDYNIKSNPGYPLMGRFKGLSEIIGLQYALTHLVE